MARFLSGTFGSAYRFLVGADIFVSYARADATTYAATLANQLTDQEFTCVLDQWDTEPGEKIPARVLRALTRSTMLVVIASPAAAQSNAVGQEVKAFRPSGRQIVPVSTDGALESAEWLPLIKGCPITHENKENLDTGAPGQHVTNRIVQSARFLKQKSRIRRSFLAAAAGLVALTIVSLWTSFQAIQTAAIAERQAALAESRGLASDALRVLDIEPDTSLRLAVKALQRFDGEASRGALLAAVDETRWVRRFLDGHQLDVADIAFSPDSRWLASVEDLPGKRLHMWNLQTLQHEVLVDDATAEPEVRTLGGGYNRVRFASGGHFVIASGPSGVDVVSKTNKEKRYPQVTTAFNPVAQQLAFLGKKYVVVQDDARGNRVFLPFLDDLGESPNEVFFTSDARYLVAHSKHHIRLWDFAGLQSTDSEIPQPGLPRRTITLSIQRGGAIKAIDIESQGGRIAILADNKIYVWDLESEMLMADPMTIAREVLVNDLALWPGHNNLVLTAGGGESRNASDPAISVWKLDSGELQGTILKSFDRQFLSISFSPDGRYLAAGDRSSHMILWDLQSGAPMRRTIDFQGAEYMAASPIDSILAVSGSDGRVALIDFAANQPIGEIDERCGSFVTGVRVSPDGKKLLLGTESGRLCLYEIETRTLIASVELETGLVLVQFDREGKIVVAADTSGRVYRFNSSTLEPTKGTTELPGGDRSRPLTFDPTAQFLLVGAGFNTETWDLEMGELLGAPALGEKLWMQFSADGRQLAHLGVLESTLSLAEGDDLQNLLSGQLASVPVTRRLKGHSEPITAFAFAPDGNWIATSALRYSVRSQQDVLDEIINPGNKFEIRIWSNSSTAPLGPPLLTNSGIKQLAFSADAQTLFSLSVDGNITAWNLDPDAWKSRAEEIAAVKN